MDDRIAEIREALTSDTEYVEAVRKGDSSLTFQPLEVIVAAARAYADLLDSDALIIRRDLAGRWPDWVLDVSPGDEQWTLELLDALASSQGVEL